MMKNSNKYRLCRIVFLVALSLVSAVLVPISGQAWAVPVANLTLWSRISSNPLGGHAWITIENISGHDLSFLNYRIRAGEMISVGSFGGNNEEELYPSQTGGIRINHELHLGYPASCFITRTITQDQLAAIAAATPAESHYHDYSGYGWSKNDFLSNFDDVAHNCTSYAMKMWNLVCSASERVNETGIDSPLGLGMQLLKRGCSEKQMPSLYDAYDVYFVTQDGMLHPNGVPTPVLSADPVDASGYVTLKWYTNHFDHLEGRSSISGYYLFASTSDNPYQVSTYDLKNTNSTRMRVDNPNTEYRFTVQPYYTYYGENVTGEKSKVVACRGSSIQTTDPVGPVIPGYHFNTGDDYPGTPTYNFTPKNCTAFVAWCLNTRNGIPFSNSYGGGRWGNAYEWDDRARALGISVDRKAAVGAVAQHDYYDASGRRHHHVMWVKEVNSAGIVIEEYNYRVKLGWSERSIPCGSADYNRLVFIHIADIVPTIARPDDPDDPPEETVMTPDCIVHIDYPRGDYNGSNHIEISGWIASRYDLTYVMGECEAFGQINLTDSLTDASEELNNAGFSAYPVKLRYRGVIDRRYLQPNTTYSMKVWAGMSNGGTSGVCVQRFNVTSIEPTVIRYTKPTQSNLSGGKDVTVSGYILSLNPITDVMARIADINGSTQTVDFDLSFQEDAARAEASETYTYAYSFTGVMPLSQVKKDNTTASVFVTAVDENCLEKVEAKTFVIGTVVRKNLDYLFTFDKKNEFDNGSVRINGSETQNISGTVYANAPIADVMVAIAAEDGSNNNHQIQKGAKVVETNATGDYAYAKTFSLDISAGDLCNVLNEDSFGEYHDVAFIVQFWADLVTNTGDGAQRFSNIVPRAYGYQIHIPQYTVRYDANGGSGAPESQTFKHASNGKGVTLHSGIPTRTGYVFRGWTTSKTSGSVKYLPNSTYCTNADVRLYAVWEKAAVLPTDMDTCDVTASVTIKNAPKVYKFVPSAKTKYRVTASGASGASVVVQDASGATVASVKGAASAEADIMLDDNTVYYFVVKPYTSNVTGTVNIHLQRSRAITFDANGGTGGPTETLYQFGDESVVLPDVIPTHDSVLLTLRLDDDEANDVTLECPVVFGGWIPVGMNWESPMEAGTEIHVDQPTGLVVSWNYSAPGTQAEPSIEGYTFVCWATSQGQTADLEEPVYDDAVYYAMWTETVPLEAIQVMPASLNLEAGDMGSLQVETVPANAIMPPIQWSSSNPDVVLVDETGTVVAQAEGASVITAVTPNGRFRASTTIIVGSGSFAIDYDTDGGEGGPAPDTVSFGEPYTIPEDEPKYEGCTFLGWSFEANSLENLMEPGETIVVDRDRTLYAVWERMVYFINYHANGGTGEPDMQVKLYGNIMTISNTIPIREGFGFAGWAPNSEAVSALFQPGEAYAEERSLDLYAIWCERARSLSLNYSSLAMVIGEERQLIGSITPANVANTAILWTSSDTSVVSVQRGRVTANGSGRATITGMIVDDPTITCTCRVTVAEPLQGGVSVDMPEIQQISGKQNADIEVQVHFATTDAAYTKLVYSYDESKLELSQVTALGEHVTIGNHAIVLALSNGCIPEGAQATLSFHIREEAAPGDTHVDVIIEESYTSDEIATNNCVAVVDDIRILCSEHSLTMIAPAPATRTEKGLGAGWVCSVCGESIAEQPVIEIDRCMWLPESLNEIESEALFCLPMQQVVIPDGTKIIGEGAFRDCKSLLIVIIPESVTSIADDAFDGCDSVCIIAAEESVAEIFANDKRIPIYLR